MNNVELEEAASTKCCPLLRALNITPRPGRSINVYTPDVEFCISKVEQAPWEHRSYVLDLKFNLIETTGLVSRHPLTLHTRALLDSHSHRMARVPRDSSHNCSASPSLFENESRLCANTFTVCPQITTEEITTPNRRLIRQDLYSFITFPPTRALPVQMSLLQRGLESKRKRKDKLPPTLYSIRRQRPKHWFLCLLFYSVGIRLSTHP
jgi:hypothetical protein